MIAEFKEKFVKRLSGAKVAKTALYCAIIAVALIVFAFSGNVNKREAEKSDAANDKRTDADSAARLEQKLEAILSSMRGVGKTRVMLTLDRTSEQVFAANEKRTNGEKNASTESRPATLQSGGREEAIVLTEVYPKIRGVIVIAEGAADIRVKLSIAAAVSTVLGIDEKNVEVFVMD